MKFMFAKFKDEIIEFLNIEYIEDEDEEHIYPSVSYISKYNRLDLCEIIYAETDSFNGIYDSLDLAAKFGNLDVAKYLTRMSVYCTYNAMDWAAIKGHLDVIQWLHSNRSEGVTSAALYVAAAYGHLNILKYLIENEMVELGRKVLASAIFYAECYENNEIAAYLRSILDENGF